MGTWNMLRIFSTFFTLCCSMIVYGESEFFHRVPQCQDEISREECSFYVKTPKKATDKAVIFFAGGDMGCDELSKGKRKSLHRLLSYYAERGYVSVAACPFLTMKAANLPSMGQQARFEHLVSSIRDYQKVREFWSGKNLLISGLSLGATTPVVLMARTEIEDSRNWQGNQFTGACFIEGVYDTHYLNSFFLQHPMSCGFMRRSGICQRYFDRRFCPKSLSDSEEIAYDSISAVAVQSFSIQQWKMVECGSALSRPKCAFPHGDWIPAQPIIQLCENIQNAPEHQCELEQIPHQSHLSCAFTPQGMDACARWFESKLVQ